MRATPNSKVETRKSGQREHRLVYVLPEETVEKTCKFRFKGRTGEMRSEDTGHTADKEAEG